MSGSILPLRLQRAEGAEVPSSIDFKENVCAILRELHPCSTVVEIVLKWRLFRLIDHYEYDANTHCACGRRLEGRVIVIKNCEIDVEVFIGACCSNLETYLPSTLLAERKTNGFK